MDTGMRALPAVCSCAGNLMLAVKNEASTAVSIEHGMPVALCAGSVNPAVSEVEDTAEARRQSGPRGSHREPSAARIAAEERVLRGLEYDVEEGDEFELTSEVLSLLAPL